MKPLRQDVLQVAAWDFPVGCPPNYVASEKVLAEQFGLTPQQVAERIGEYVSRKQKRKNFLRTK